MAHITKRKKMLALRSINRAANEITQKKNSVCYIGHGEHFSYPTGLNGWRCNFKIQTITKKTITLRILLDETGHWKLHTVNKSRQAMKIAQLINLTR